MAATRYGELRNQLLRQSFPNIYAPAILRDADSQYHPLPISERLVQCIWYDQRVQPLQTSDARPVQVIFPGWWNLEAGPDFRHATIKIGNDDELTGDVEIHLRADDWFHHGHDRDPLYDNVILHIVLWPAGNNRAPAGLPQVVLQNQLAAPLEELYDEIDIDAYPHNATDHTGRCAPLLRNLPDTAVASLLDSAGDERFAGKTRRFARRIHHVGAEQAFYEGWMEALGYKSNKAAFRLLAQRVSTGNAAVFFGVAGFLPTKLTDAHGKRLWSQWWKLRPDYEDRILPKDTWNLAGIRPANHPHRRLGAAVALLKRHGKNFAEKVVAAIETDGDPAKLFLQVRDDYWQRHFTLGGQPQSKPTELLGTTRVDEIVANIVLPFVAAHEPRLVEKCKTRYAALRPASDNAIVRLAGKQLFDTARPRVKTFRQQQGLIQIFQDFCLNDKSACRQCQFPELVKQWENQR